jgi:ABC-type bacteriocin/lantibiotic exporter with double-glycine peptidase domain
MKPVVQEEKTGCGIASVAALAGVTYKQARRAAHELGIHAGDSSLWSDTRYVRRLLQQFGIRASRKEASFVSWEGLPRVALLAIKWHKENRRPFWHWVVFVRENGKACVLDSKKSLRSHRRTDFGRMHPKWFIAVTV